MPERLSFRLKIAVVPTHKSTESAPGQIRSKRYYRAAWERGKPVIGIGVQFSSTTKNIEAWEMEEM